MLSAPSVSDSTGSAAELPLPVQPETQLKFEEKMLGGTVPVSNTNGVVSMAALFRLFHAMQLPREYVRVLSICTADPAALRRLPMNVQFSMTTVEDEDPTVRRHEPWLPSP